MTMKQPTHLFTRHRRTNARPKAVRLILHRSITNRLLDSGSLERLLSATASSRNNGADTTIGSGRYADALIGHTSPRNITPPSPLWRRRRLVHVQRKPALWTRVLCDTNAETAQNWQRVYTKHCISSVTYTGPYSFSVRNLAHVCSFSIPSSSSSSSSFNFVWKNIK